jgi:hypothetical protein
MINTLGSGSVIVGKGKEIEIKKWYRVEVDYNFEKVEVRIQTGNIREKKVLIETKLSGLHRGSVGFATNGKY